MFSSPRDPLTAAPALPRARPVRAIGSRGRGGGVQLHGGGAAGRPRLVPGLPRPRPDGAAHGPGARRGSGPKQVVYPSALKTASFLGVGSPTKIDHRKTKRTGTLILEDMAKQLGLATKRAGAHEPKSRAICCVQRSME